MATKFRVCWKEYPTGKIQKDNDMLDRLAAEIQKTRLQAFSPHLYWVEDQAGNFSYSNEAKHVGSNSAN